MRCMNMLRTFLDGAPRGSATAIAKAVGVHPVMVSQWASGDKPVPVDRATKLEAATGGAVMRWHSRPDDWHVHWPELVKLHRQAPHDQSPVQEAA